MVGSAWEVDCGHERRDVFLFGGGHFDGDVSFLLEGLVVFSRGLGEGLCWREL